MSLRIAAAKLPSGTLRSQGTLRFSFRSFATQWRKGGTQSSDGSRDSPRPPRRFDSERDSSDGKDFRAKPRREAMRFDSRGPRRQDSRPFSISDNFNKDFADSRRTGELPYPGYMEDKNQQQSRPQRIEGDRFRGREERFQKRGWERNPLTELNDPREEAQPEAAAPAQAYRFDRERPQMDRDLPSRTTHRQSEEPRTVHKKYEDPRTSSRRYEHPSSPARPTSSPSSTSPPPPPPPPKISPQEAIEALKQKISANAADLPARFDLALVHLKVAASSEAPQDVTPSAAGRSKLSSFWTEVTTHLSDAMEQVRAMAANAEFCQKLTSTLQQKMTALQRADLLTRLNTLQGKLNRDPADILACIGLSHLLLLQHGVNDISIKRLQTAENLARAEAIFSDALRIELNETEYAKAADMYREVLKLQPDHSGALTNLAVYLYYKHLPKTLAEIQAAAANETDSEEKSVTAPASIKRTEIVDEVRQLLKRAAATNWNRRNHLCHYHLAYLLEIEDNATEAAKMEYSKALIINNKHFPSHLNLGSLLMVDGLTDMALPHYRAAVKYSESNLKVLPLFALANALSRKGLFDEAVFYSKQAIVETEMKDPQAYYHLANIFLNNKKITDAIENYKRCIELSKTDPSGQFDHAPAINNLIVTLRRAANMFISKGKTILDFGTAARFLAESIELTNKDGDNPDLVAIQRMNLAYCLMKANQPDTAAKQMSIAITEAGQTFLDNFREVKQAKISPEVVQQLESHIDLAGTAPEKSPDRARAHYNIAFCLFHMGEAAAAMGHLEEAVEHDPAARSDYLAREDFTESVELSQGNQKKKGKKSKRIIDDAEEDLNDAAFNDMDAIARAKMNDAAMLTSKEKKPAEEFSGSVAESNVADVDKVERKPEAEISAASTAEKQPKMHKSKKLRREAIEKAVFGPATTGGGVIGMSEEDMKVAKDLIPLLKKRAVESSKSRAKDKDLDDDDDEIDAADLPKTGEKIMLMSKEQWQDLEKGSGATKQSKVKVSKKKTLKAVKKSLVAKKVGLKKKVKSVTKKPKSTKPSESNSQ